MYLVILAVTVVTNLFVSVSTNAVTINNPVGDNSNNTIAQQTCGMTTLNELESSFPIGTIVNDGYTTYQVVDYSPTFGSVQGVKVDIYGNPTSQAKFWLCYQTLRIGRA